MIASQEINTVKLDLFKKEVLPELGANVLCSFMASVPVATAGSTVFCAVASVFFIVIPSASGVVTKGNVGATEEGVTVPL